MRIAILGAPGSNKEARAKSLAALHRVPYIAIDDLARAAAAKAATASKPRRADLTDMELIEERLRARDSRRGFIIDGFPRNIPQAQALDALIGMLGWSLQIAVYIKADDDILIKRLAGRLRCTQCGAERNRYCAPPASRSKCDECGGKLLSAGRRTKQFAIDIAAYHEESAPLVAYYKAQHKLRTVIAADSDAEVERKISEIVDLEVRPLEIKTLETAANTTDEEVSTVIAGGQINRIAPPPEPEAAPAPPDVAALTPAAPTPAARAAEHPPAEKKINKPAPKAVKAPVAKKSVVKKPATKKPAVKKTGAKNTVAKKVAAKKIAVKNTVAKKTTAKKPASKKASAKKTTAKHSPVKSTTAKKATPKRSSTKSTTAKKTTAKGSPTKTSTTAKKTTKKKTLPKTTSKTTRKTAKKTAAKKPAPRKPAAKKPTTKRPSATTSAKRKPARKR